MITRQVAGQPTDRLQPCLPIARRRHRARDDAARACAERHPDLGAVHRHDQEIGRVRRCRITRCPHRFSQLSGDGLPHLDGVDDGAGSRLDDHQQRVDDCRGGERRKRRRGESDHTDQGEAFAHIQMSPQPGRLFNVNASTVDRLAVHEVASILRRGRRVSMLRLYTFQISHFAEKARWALDWKGVKYQERRLARASPGGDAAAGKSHLGAAPGVRRPGGAGIRRHHRFCRRALAGSPAHVTDRGGPGPGARARALARTTSSARRARVFYFHALGEPNLVRPLLTQRGPWWGGVFLSRGLSRGRQPHPRPLQGQRGHGGQDASGWRPFSRVDGLRGTPVSGGRPLGRADLTLAALAAPLWGPPEHSTRWPPDEAYPARLRELRAGLVAGGSATTSWHYREHRAADAAARCGPRPAADRV